MRIWIIAGTVLVALLAAIGLYVAGVFLGWHGHSRGPGTITGDAIPAAVVSERAQAQLAAADAAGGPTETQILFGCLCVGASDAARRGGQSDRGCLRFCPLLFRAGFLGDDGPCRGADTGALGAER